MNKQAKHWEKIFAIHISDITRLISRLYKELSTLKNDNKILQNGQKIRTDTLSKKLYKWQISTKKDSRHNYALEKCKLISQRTPLYNS